MVESTDSRERDHAAVFGGLHVATMRRSLVQRLVNPVFVIIDDVRAEKPSKMLFTKHDHGAVPHSFRESDARTSVVLDEESP